MKYINGCTFGLFGPRGFTATHPRWRESMRLMAEETGCDTVVLAVAALQDHAYSTRVDYETPDVASMDDLKEAAAEARRLGLRVIVKAMVNCRDGYWRAYIRFFDSYVPTEPTWDAWFASYTRFVTALADTAQEIDADMLCVGCEMVGTDHRDAEWRALIREVRAHYSGPLTYNCDKYQEHRVSWWDALDVMSSSGYYPIDQLDTELARVEAAAEKAGKPFFFIESGCPSREGSEYIPNNWGFAGPQSNEAQMRWYQAFTDALLRHPRINGTVWWDWSALRLYPTERAATDNGYGLHGKPVLRVLKQFGAAVQALEEK